MKTAIAFVFNALLARLEKIRLALLAAEREALNAELHDSNWV